MTNLSIKNRFGLLERSKIQPGKTGFSSSGSLYRSSDKAQAGDTIHLIVEEGEEIQFSPTKASSTPTNGFTGPHYILPEHRMFRYGVVTYQVQEDGTSVKMTQATPYSTPVGFSVGQDGSLANDNVTSWTLDKAKKTLTSDTGQSLNIVDSSSDEALKADTGLRAIPAREELAGVFRALA